jgi:hypothetical protein
MTVKVKFKGDKIKVQAGEGYRSDVKDLLILTDNLDYAALEYLYFAYKAILEKEG